MLANKIDHTILKPTTTVADIERLCNEAIKYGFVAVCVPPFYAEKCVKILHDYPTRVASVVGFPLGYDGADAKLTQSILLIRDAGVDEIDMVANIAAIKDGNWDIVEEEIESVGRITQFEGAMLKVIIETGLLTDEEIVKVCEICAECEVDFVKTSTGFNGTGATIEAVQLIRKSLPSHIQIKASGGIRTRAFAEALIAAGADRLGCSQGVQIINESGRVE